MKTNKAICSPDFYENVGFNTIRTWLGEHCLCSLNEGYFHELVPLSSKVEIEQSQSFSDELLASFLRNSPVLLETIPDITEIFSIMEIAGAQLNADHFQELYQILNCSSRIKQALKKNAFPLWHSNSRNLINSSAAVSAIEKVFDAAFQMKIDASAELKRLLRAIVTMEGKIKDTMVKLMTRARSENWLQGDFIKSVQQRGAAIIKARGASSAASAANAVIDTIQRLNTPTPAGEWFSTAIPSDGSYGIPEGIMFSYPVRSKGDYDYEIVQTLELNEFGQQRIQTTREELEMEKEAVSDLLG
mgnify:CR=1 FL=1